MKIVNKIAFFVHEPVMYAHYASVWAQMKKDEFVIVLFERCENEKDGSECQAFVDQIKVLGYEIDRFTEIIRRGVKYRYAISNHCMGGSSLLPASKTTKLVVQMKNLVKRALNIPSVLLGKRRKFNLECLEHIHHPPLQIGIKQIRFMYGADISDGWSLQNWNQMYDLFLCHGPNDEHQIKKKFKGKTSVMGYPRYDGYFLPSLDIDVVIREFSIDQSKDTILWMPTYDMFNDGVCSIPYFATVISNLMEKYNVIVRPHPISFKNDPDGIELLESLNYKIDRNSMRDMNGLYGIADAVLCDHGGSAFGVLYLGKKLIFLETPLSNNAKVAKNSSNQELMRNYPVINVEDVANLEELLNNEKYWQECMRNGLVLSNRYFADYKGTSSKKAAEILSNLDAVI